MSRAAVFAAVISMCLSAQVSAQTSGWDASFPANATSSWVTGNKPRLLVVGAGEGAELLEAEKALVAALRNGGRTMMVMTDEVLGDVVALGDPDIVKKASAFPVDQLAVLRVFPGGEGAPSTAVVTFYLPDGTVVSALTAQKGTALAEKAGASTPGMGVSNEAAAAVDQVAQTMPSTAQTSEAYEKSFIGFDDVAVVNTQNGAVVSTHTLPYQGKYKKPLEGVAFYETIGRKDLVEQYNARSTTRTALWVGGGVGMVVGAGLMMLPLLSREECSINLPDSAFSDCLDRRTSSMMTGLLVGTGVMTGGAVLFLVGSWHNPHPVTPAQARELADEYNKGLKAKLNVAEQKQRAQRNDFTLAVSPVVGFNGGGLAFSGTF